MKICPSCNIQIDGDRETCPFCQNTMTGTGSEANWPPVTKLRHRAMLYKIQLFIVLVCIAVSLFLDFMLKLNNGIHYSLLVALWGITAEWLIRHYIKNHIFATKIVTISSVIGSVLLCISAYYLSSGGWLFQLVFYYITPGIIAGTIIANFVFALIDKRGNSLIYLLAMLVIGVIPYIALKIVHEDLDLFWSICMMTAIVTTLAIVVFRGKTVLTELQKRFMF